MNLRPAADAVRKLFGKGGVILLYHRVTRLQRDPQLLAVTPEHFAEHLEVLRRKAHVMPLRELAASQEAGFPARSVAVTFDDGYADNFLEARPLLERYEVPATVFVVSGSVGSDREFWWDDLDRMLLETGDSGWHVECESDREPRHSRYKELCKEVRALSGGGRSRILEQVREATGSAPAGRPTHRAMTHEELRRFAEGGLVEIGAHTETHPRLSALPVADQKKEIERSRQQIEQFIGKPVESFAYPYGGKADYTKESVACTRAAGFTLACSNYAGMIWPRTSRFELPRFLIRDWSGDRFEQMLDEIFK